MERPLSSLRYLTSFRCVADACVDTCCSGLRVTVDHASLDRLRVLTSGADPLNVRAHLETGGPDAPPEHAAVIRMNAQGACPMLDAQRLCGLQQRYGLDGLGDACAQFPRSTRAAPEIDEVAGSLACPEALRLLLSTDDPLSWVDVGPGFLPRRPALPPDPASGESRLGPLRQALVRGMLQQETPLGARWLLAAEQCLELEAGWASGADAQARLASMRSRWESHPTPEQRARARLLVTSLELPMEKLVELLAGAVTDRLSQPHPPRLAERFVRAGPPSTWCERYLEARRTIDPPCWLRLERNLALAASNGLLRNPVALERDPGRSLGVEMVRSALATLLLTLELAGTGASREQVDACSVETLQLLAKYVDSHPALVTRAQALFDVPREERFRRALLLALVFPHRDGVTSPARPHE